MRSNITIAKRAEIVRLLVEGAGVRAIERHTTINRDVVCRAIVITGRACRRLHELLVRGIQAGDIEADEMHTFVGAKDANLRPGHPAEYGSQWLWLALDVGSRLILSWRVGPRNLEEAVGIMRDLRGRVVGRPHLSTDGLEHYRTAVAAAFRDDVDYGMLPGKGGHGPIAIIGNPDPARICTSHIERLNLTIRMGMRRCARRTNAHSKRIAHLRGALAIQVAHYCFCRVHETLGMTPMMKAGITSRPWTVTELLLAAHEYELPEPVAR